MNPGGLELQNAVVGIGKHRVLGPIDYSLSSGEVGVLMGPNGSGKSTLLKSIAGLLPLFSGLITVGGEDLARTTIRMRAERVAWVPQEESTEFAFTVREYVAMARLARSGLMFETAEDRQAVEAAFDLTQSRELENRRITELSGGEKQRVMITRAVAQGTNLILLDEPVSHLDIHYQVEVVELIKHLAKSGKTVLMSVHDLRIAGAINGKVLLVNQGECKFVGSIEQLGESPELENAFEHKFERVVLSNGSVQWVPTFSTTGH